MVLFLGLFLINTLCAIVPCQRQYEYPVPVPISDNEGSSGTRRVYDSSGGFTIPIMPKEGDFVVKIESGLVQGFPMKTIRARDIYAFTGIPYAEPPIHSLRYRAPLKKGPWEGVLQANRMPKDCTQVDGMQLLRIVGSEDCLYANVYTPILPSTGTKRMRLPVLVFIHGGSFAFSSGSKYGPSYLLDQDILLVTFNYRLGSFGFLSSGDEAAPGNWGLKDQLLLLQWVQTNIESFGGDPKQVTIFGQSAGAVSVHLHMLSEKSQGLFRSGISQSGNAFCFWGVREASVDYTFRLASALRCPVNESRAMVDCLRDLDPLLITFTEANLPEYKVFPGVFFGPVVEAKGPDAFLEDRPEVLYAQNKVAPIPWINGFVAEEGNGIGFLAWLYPLVLQDLDQKWSQLGPSILDIEGDMKSVSRVSSHVREYYLQDRPINHDNVKGLTQMMGDRLILAAVHKGLEYHHRVAPTYGYFFNYTGRFGVAGSQGLNVDDWGISHDDDLIYLLNSTIYQALKVGEPEYEMSEFITNVWASFARHGEPTFQMDHEKEIHFWEKIDNFSKPFPLFRLSADPKMISFPYLERIKFWDDMGLISRSIVGPLTIPTPTPLPVNVTVIETKSTEKETSSSSAKTPLKNTESNPFNPPTFTPYTPQLKFPSINLSNSFNLLNMLFRPRYLRHRF